MIVKLKEIQMIELEKFIEFRKYGCIGCLAAPEGEAIAGVATFQIFSIISQEKRKWLLNSKKYS